MKIDYEKAEQYIKESEKQWAEAVASGDSTVIQRILADDFIGVDTKVISTTNSMRFMAHMMHQSTLSQTISMV